MLKINSELLRKGLTVQKEHVLLFINDKNPRIIPFPRVQIGINRGIVDSLQRAVRNAFQHQCLNSNLVKKTVRIDSDLCLALYNEVGDSETCINTYVNKVVSEKLPIREIDLIPTRKFSSRITLRFSKEDYQLINQVIDELRNRRNLRWVTFSLLIRSILYESLDIAMDVRSEKVRASMSGSNETGTAKGLVTNVISTKNNGFNKKQKVVHKKLILKGQEQ